MINILASKTLESLYLLWRTTGDIKWREYGWTIFEAIEKHCKAYTGYASVYDVEIKTARKMNDMPRYVFSISSQLQVTSSLMTSQLFHGGNVRCAILFSPKIHI